jgi:hypothetical protein
MLDPPSTTDTRRLRAGPLLTYGGLILCGLAMVVGFFIALAMHLFDDPEQPAAIYGKLFAGVLLVLVIGVVLAVVGALLPKPARPTVRRRRPTAEESPTDKQSDGSDEIGPAPTPPSVPTRQWDDAYSGSHRRR